MLLFFALHAALIVQKEHELVYIIIVHFYFQQVNYNLVSWCIYIYPNAMSNEFTNAI